MVEASAAFVCAADEVWRLQRGSEPDCVFFQRAVNKGQRITDRGTRQGVYVMTAGGRLLARNNSHRAEAVLELLDRGLAAWAALTPEQRAPLDADEVRALTTVHRWESSRPDDGLVLERIGRELSAESPGGAPLQRWNRDFAWFSRSELESLVPEQARAGDTLDLAPMAVRLARFHLVDNVRGQTIPYAAEEVRRAELGADVVERRGSVLQLELRGHTDAHADGPWLMGPGMWKPNREVPHGLECVLAGSATFDLAAGRFTAFELIGVARRWGHTINNGRWRDPAPGRLGFQLQLDATGLGLAPTFVSVYDADWIEPPAVATWIDSPEECGLESVR